MSDRTPRPGRRAEAGRASAWKSPRTWRVLAVVFSVAALGSVALVVVDLALHRPAAGDLFIAFLNSLAAVALWRLGFQTRRT